MIHVYTTGTGTIALNSDNPEFGGYGSYGIVKVGPIYATNSSYTGKDMISAVDVNAKKVSGTFEFRAVQVEPVGSRVVNVKGSFEDVPIM